MRRVQLHSVLSRIASQQSTSLNDAADRVILPFSSHCSGKPVVPMLKLRPLLLYCVSAWLFAFCLDAASGQTSDNSKNSDFDHLAKSAALARESGKNTEAIERYQRALELRSDWEEGWWYLGTLLYDTDRFAEAVPALRKVVQMDASLGPAWNFLGLCEFETHDYANALLDLQKGEALEHGDDPEIARVSKYHLALLLIRNSEFDRAWPLLISAELNNGSAQIKKALALCLLRVPLLPQDVDPSRDALIQSAGEAASILAHGKSDAALNPVRDLVDSYPTIPYLHYAYGIALASAGRDVEALLQQRQELKLQPQSALAQTEISKLNLLLHHSEAALLAAETAVRFAPRSPAAYRVLAQCEQAVGAKDKAAQAARTADSLSSEKPEREARMDQLYALHATSPRPEATGIPSSQTGNFELFEREAAASEASGNTAGAIRNYEQALKLRPDWNDGRWNLAMLRYQSGNYPEAITSLKVFLQEKPNDGTAWAVMGLSEFEIKDYNNALIHLQRGQEFGFGGSPDSVQLARYRLAILLNRNSKFENAMEVLTPVAGATSLEKEGTFARGMSLLRMPLMPEQVETSKRDLVQSAGETAIYLQNSKYDEALPKLRIMLQSHPAVPFLHYAYGMALLSLSQYEDAAEQFRQEQTISPASELPNLRLASISLRTHRPAEGVQFAEHAVRMAPDSGEAHYILGKAYLALGEDIAAIAELEIAVKISPSSPEVHFNLAKAYGKAGLQDKEQHERVIFTRLNELAQKQRSTRGSQSYGAARDTTDFHPAGVEPVPDSPQPQ